MAVETTLDQLRNATIAHTDKGPYYIIQGRSYQEALVKGTITKSRPSLYYVDIDGETFTAIKRKRFKPGDEVWCRLSLEYKDDAPVFTILSLELA